MVEAINNADFTDVDASAEAVTLIRHLDQITASDRVQASKRRTAALLDVRAGDAIIDVGCGTGEDARALAALVGPTGRVVGVDKSAALIKAARSGASTTNVSRSGSWSASRPPGRQTRASSSTARCGSVRWWRTRSMRQPSKLASGKSSA